MRHFYYYVPPCPKCGSRKTGRYMKMPFTGSGYTKEDSLKNGEWVRFAKEEPIENCFCMTCGTNWSGKVSLKWWPFDRIQEEIRARETEPVYQQMLEEKGMEEPGHWDFGAKRRQSLMADEYVKSITPKEKVRLEPDIIDERKRDTITLLYADEELLEKIRRKNI